MINITFQNQETSDWHIGDMLPNTYLNMSNIVSIEVDGDELNHIRYQYGYYVGLQNNRWCFNIPFIDGAKKMLWYGDIAKTIVANL